MAISMRIHMPAVAAVLVLFTASAVPAQQRPSETTITSLRTEIESLHAAIAILTSQIAAAKAESAALAAEIKARMVAPDYASVPTAEVDARTN
jgi:hypothetical protein